jgi:hypothetical protein
MRRATSPTSTLRDLAPLDRLFRGVFLCVLLGVPSVAHAQSGPIEAAFAAVPFKEWVAEGPKAELRWHPQISSPKLTLYQRLAVQIGVELDGKELTKRCCEGQAIALVEIEDNRGRVYRNYGEKDLKDAKPGLNQYMAEISWEVFLLPGDYKTTIAFHYSDGSGHSLVTRTIHVEPLRHDPLPQAWQDLPAVEFWDAPPESPEELFLPNVAGRLHLSAKGKREIHLEILENLTPYPSERRQPQLYTDRLDVFLPILSTFAQVQIEGGTVGFSLLDFGRQRVIFDQQDIRAGQVPWSKLKGAIAANSVGAVDVHDLQREDELGEFFRRDMTQRLDGPGDDEAIRAFVVISSPMDLGTQTPIEVAPQGRGKFAVFYLESKFLQTPIIERRSGVYGATVERSEQSLERLDDGVGKALRELKPRVFAVDSAQGVREALAAVLHDLSRM